MQITIDQIGERIKSLSPTKEISCKVLEYFYENVTMVLRLIRLQSGTELQKSSYLKWDDDTRTLTVDGNSKVISMHSYTQLYALPILFKAGGRWVSNKKLCRVGDHETFRFDHIVKRINKDFPGLIQGDNERGWCIPSLRKTSK